MLLKILRLLSTSTCLFYHQLLSYITIFDGILGICRDNNFITAITTVSPYFDDLRCQPAVINPPQNEDCTDIGEHMNEPAQHTAKPNVTVSSSVRELLECPVCLNAMYPPIHQV